MVNDLALSKKVGEQLIRKKLSLATAESCTGGLLGHLLTNVAGSSDYYLGGFVVYSNQAKQRFLGVSPDKLVAHGAVSEETVIEMAEGARKAFEGIQEKRKIGGVSISGIAGPGGGMPAKPVGTVWIGLAGEWGILARHYQFNGDRETIKAQSARQALRLLLEFLSIK